MSLLSHPPSSLVRRSPRDPGTRFGHRKRSRRGFAVVILAWVGATLFLGGQGGSELPEVGANPHSPLDPAEPPTGELWVQNMSATDPTTSVTARFFDPSRSYDFSPLLLNPPPRAADLLRIGSVTASLPRGHYAAAVGPNTPFPSAGVARNEWPASGAAVLYGASASDQRVVVPWVARRFGPEEASSRVRIQNARSDRSVEVTVRITALGADTPSATVLRSIPAGGATEIDLAGDASLSLPTGFAGSLNVEAAAGGQVAALALTELEASGQAAYAAIGSPAAALGERLVAPRVTRRRSETRGDGSQATTESFIAVANTGDAAAQVSVSYRGYDTPGNACAGQTVVHGGAPHAIPPRSAAVFAQGADFAGGGVGTSGLPENCEASVVISAGAGARLAATVVEIEDGGTRAAAYEAQASAGAQRVVYAPLIRRGYDDLSTSIHVANAGSQTSLAQLKLTVVAQDRTIVVERSASLAPGAGASWDARALAEIPEGAIGAAVVTGARQDTPLVALVRETADDGKKDNAIYTGFVEPPKIDHPAPRPDEYQPFFAPSMWHAGVYDLGLMATGSTPAEMERIKTNLNAQAFAFARRTGLTIAVSVQPYMQGKVPFHDWLRGQIDAGFPDVEVKARTWLVGLNYNGVTLLGRSGHVAPVDSDYFPGQGDFLDEAWALNFVTGGDAPSAVPWLREGCSPNFRNLALVATSMDADDGFELMQFLARQEQQRENYAPQSPGRSQIGYPTLKGLYTALGIQCPVVPGLVRTAPDRVDAVVGAAVRDAERLAQVFDDRDVDLYNDGANAAKAVGVQSERQLVIAQPMINHLAPDDMRLRLRSSAGLVVGSISLRTLPTPTPTDTSTPTQTSTPSATPTATAEPSLTATPEPSLTASPTPSLTATATPTATGSATRSTPGTATPTASRTPSVSVTPSPSPTEPPIPWTSTPTATVQSSPPILLPFLARSFDFAAPAVPAAFNRAAAGPRDRPPARPARGHQAPEGGDAYAIVWREGAGGAIRTEIVDVDGQVVDPATIGIAVPTVAPGFPGGVEPEGWVQRGSVIVCINVDQYKGCLTVED